MNYWIVPSGIDKDKESTYKTEMLINRVCSIYNITKKDIKANVRFREIVEARKIVMYILHKHYKMSSTATGKIFKKDHSTVLHACKSVLGLMEFDKEFNNRVNSLI